MSALISIIVPVYNTEQFLRRCVDSIIGQTYRNLEVFLVNDGSTDNSGLICDEYAAADKRITVIHKSNGGLSEARNVALDCASGKYLSFIDSDDFVTEDYIEYLLKLLTNHNADISICNSIRFWDERQLPLKTEKKSTEDRLLSKKQREAVSFTNIEALRNMFYQRDIGHSQWGKLYKTKLYKNIRFPSGKIFEDVGTAYKVIWNTSKIVYGSQEHYFYYQRPGSITKSPFSLKRMDVIDFNDEIVEWVDIHCSELKKAASHYHISRDFQTLLKMPPNIQTSPEALRLRANIRKYRRLVLFDKNARAKNRMASLLSYFGFRILKAIWNLYDS